MTLVKPALKAVRISYCGNLYRLSSRDAYYISTLQKSEDFKVKASRRYQQTLILAACKIIGCLEKDSLLDGKARHGFVLLMGRSRGIRRIQMENQQ